MQSSLKGKTISGFIWKFAERMSAQLTTTVVSIILARALLPEDYGIIAIVTVFIAICNVLVVDGLGSSLIQKEKADDIDFSSVFYCSLGLSGLLYGVLYISAPLIAQYYNMPVLSPVLRVMGIRLILSAVNSVQQAYVSRKMQFRKFFFATLIGTVLSGVVGIYMARQNYGVWALVAQYLLNTTVNTIILFFSIRWRPKLVFSFERLKGLFSYGWKITAGSLLNELYKSLRTLIIGKVYSTSDLSYYNKGQTYPSLLSTNINSSITSVLFPAISKVQGDKERVRQMLRKSIITSSYFVFPLLLGFCMIAEEFVKIILTEKWSQSIPYVRMFCIAFCATPLTTVNLQAIKAMGYSDIALKQEVIKKTTGIVMILITVNISVMAVVIGAVIIEYWYFVVNTWPNKKIINYSLIQQVADIMPNLIISVIMALLVWCVGLFDLPLLHSMVVKIPVGVTAYAALSFAQKNETFFYLINMLRKK